MRPSLSLLLPALAAASPLSISTIHKDAAPVLSSMNAATIPDSYMVVFKDHVDHKKAAAHHSWVMDLHNTHSAELRKRSQLPIVDDIFEGLKHSFNIPSGLMGYSGHFDESVLEQIRRHPDVDFVERDSIVHTMGHDDSVTEKNAPWGLARISHRDGLSFGNFNKYIYSEDGGEGVDVYVIDTGTNVDHADFEGRAKWGKTIPEGDPDEDGNGHGTHCSGTVAGKKYGVAKKANIRAVKVLRSSGSGTMSDVVRGVEYAVTAHEKQVKAAKDGKRKGFRGSTANMSLGGGKSPTLDKAVNAAVDAGIHFAVAAGNDNADSCNYSPAAADKAVTVGASNLQDERAFFSNYGKCNDIFAPGLNILSTWIGGKHAINTISGTSMASPHIAGLLAYLLSLQPASDSAYAVAEVTPKKLKADLLAIATRGALSQVPSNTKNILAWNGGGSSNYSEIISQGGYQIKGVESEYSIPTLSEMEEEFELFEDSLEEELGRGWDEVERYMEGAKKTKASASEKIEKITGKIDDLISEELKGFLEEVRA